MILKDFQLEIKQPSSINVALAILIFLSIFADQTFTVIDFEPYELYPI